MTVKDLNIIYTGQEYQLLGGHAWIDVHTLTVHIMRVKDGVRVEVYPASHDGVSEPVAACRAAWEEPAPESSTKVVRRYVK